MQSRIKEPYRKGVANRLASSLAEAVAMLPSKRRQRYHWAGYGAAKTLNRDADPVIRASRSRVKPSVDALMAWMLGEFSMANVPAHSQR